MRYRIKAIGSESHYKQFEHDLLGVLIEGVLKDGVFAGLVCQSFRFDGQMVRAGTHFLCNSIEVEEVAEDE